MFASLTDDFVLRYRTVLDANTVASATISQKGNSARILDAWREGKIELIISVPIIVELRRVLFYDRIRKYSYMTVQEVYELINNLERSGIRTPALLEIDVIQTDPTDNKWIVAAVEGNADYIVSGDEHLKRLGSYQGIPIVTPAQFVKILEEIGS